MPVLNHLNFTAKPGQITAIIGSTGSGKSTLVKLLPRFYDITEGSILLDGKDIREYSQKSLRKQIGYVPQTAALFSGTVRDNLLLGDENASEEDMLEAIRIAQAEEFILSEEEGLNRDVSQSGTNLSGGQKQRLSIARAIVRKPSIYIFDDSFSALDFATDFKLRKELTPFIQQSTVFIVAQRVSTILHADQIVVLDEGNIVGIGTHQDLMKTSSVYQEIVQSQITVEEAA
jgi:ATP-binding cassette, subfamily B, multidrug efflux pump